MPPGDTFESHTEPASTTTGSPPAHRSAVSASAPAAQSPLAAAGSAAPAGTADALSSAGASRTAQADAAPSAGASRTAQADAAPSAGASRTAQAPAEPDRPAPRPAKGAPPASQRLPLRDGPVPLRGGPLAFWRFARRHNMLRWGYVSLIARWAWLKLRYRGRFVTDGLCFVLPGVQFEIGPEAKVIMGRWSWLGHGTKVRVHEGTLEIGAKTVFGQECTISCYQSISVGRECIIADRTMMIDFDHGMVETERPIREQGIYKRDVSVGHNVWIGYGACLLRGVSVGDNAVIGTSSVVTKDIPDNAVAGGVPAEVIRMRDAPQTFRWG